MISIPHIQIRQQYAKLGMDSEPGQQDIRQPPATLEMSTTPLRMEITYRNPDIEIDQSRAWAALGLGGILEAMTRIHARAREVGLDGIARIVENGNRMAAIHLHTNAIADIAEEQAFEFYEFDYVGPASVDNVDIHITTHKPEIEFTGGTLEIDAHPHKPIINYDRGKLDIYMLQYPKVEIIPPSIDLKL